MSDHPICHVEIPALDPATLSTFYAEVFDWHTQADPTSSYHLFQPQRGAGGAFVQVEEATGTKVGQVLICSRTRRCKVVLHIDGNVNQAHET